MDDVPKVEETDFDKRVEFADYPGLDKMRHVKLELKRKIDELNDRELI